MQDNVRRGGEIVGGQGGAVPDFPFATLYRLQKWVHGELKNEIESGRMVALKDDLTELI